MNFGDEYLADLARFLHSIKWMFCVVNTHFVSQDVIHENREFVKQLSEINLSNFPELKVASENHPKILQSFIEQVNSFRINFETINNDAWKSKSIKKMSVKKQYEIENVSKVISLVCEDNSIVDCGSGLGYLGHYLFDKFGFRVLGLEGSDDRVEKAKERQRKFHPRSLGEVKHVQHFITSDSSEFILEQLKEDSSPIGICGLHGCGDLTVTAIKLFLSMERVKNLIFMPCCYHKMTQRNSEAEEFNHFPLSEELKKILQNYPTFLNRPFLRLAGQQSPEKWKETTQRDHWIHGKNMFERSVVEAMLLNNETMKRINHTNFPENRLTIDEVLLKYQLLDKSSGSPKAWTESHHQRFKDIREKYPDGEEMSENLFCLQTTIQTICENLVLVDRIRFIQEEGNRRNLKLSVTVKKLQNDKLSPRCSILIVKKF